MLRAAKLAAAAFFLIFGILFAFEFSELISLKRGAELSAQKIKRLAALRDRLNALAANAEEAAGADAHTQRLIREKLGLIKSGEKVFIFAP